MFKKIIAATIMSAALAVTMQTNAFAGGGDGGFDNNNGPRAGLQAPKKAPPKAGAMKPSPSASAASIGRSAPSQSWSTPSAGRSIAPG